MTKVEKAERIIDTLTGAWEKRNLPKMAAALPKWVTPDHLTVLGLIAGFIIAAGYILCIYSKLWLILASLGLILHWYADSLDGTLARVRHIEKEKYGYFVDHLSDAWTTLILCVALGISPLMLMEIALFVGIGYLLINVYSHISAYTKNEFQLSFGKFGPTEVRIFIIIVNTILIFWNPILLQTQTLKLTFLDFAGLGTGFIFMLIFISASFKGAKDLNRLEKQNR